MKFENIKILLILNNFADHLFLELSNVEMFFLPPNTTSLTQPTDVGNIKNLKHHYKRFMAKKRLSCFNSGMAFKTTYCKHWNGWIKHGSLSNKTQFTTSIVMGNAQCAEIASAYFIFEDFVAIGEEVLTGDAAAAQVVDNLLDTVLSSNETADGDSSVPKFREAMYGLETALLYQRSTKNSDLHCQSELNAHDYYMDTQLSLLSQRTIASYFKPHKERYSKNSNHVHYHII
ncbi:Tigger transposable element-derived protein 4-like [Oopsacas minuta]|uniref:Tigger transposable element-derived protein 4-like n=1 Tax=Oopsacas minuta TaxID=111878 RepID=A0AAV7JVL4_9METZ|nr:Tigger transposable element-derived protein 4-like [Oopsacas minuta]